jgi:hypothetical protein
VADDHGLVRVDEVTNGRGLASESPEGDLAITAGSIWLAGCGDAKLLRFSPVD